MNILMRRIRVKEINFFKKKKKEGEFCLLHPWMSVLREGVMGFRVGI